MSKVANHDLSSLLVFMVTSFFSRRPRRLGSPKESRIVLKFFILTLFSPEPISIGFLKVPDSSLSWTVTEDTPPSVTYFLKLE